MRLLVAAITDDKSEGSLGFAVSMLRFQVAIVTKDIQVDVHYFPTLDQALNAFSDHDEYDLGFFASTSITFDSAFVFEAIESKHPFVTGIYPLPGIQWDKVQDSMGDNPKRSGTKFNVTLSSPSPQQQQYALVTSADLGAFVIRRVVIDTIKKNHPELAHASGCLFYASGVHDGKYEDAHSRFLRLWAGAVHADTKIPCGNFGSVDFIGCIGARPVIR